MILSCQNINKTFVDDHLLKDVSFHINDYDKAALIGINGCGKTTLLRIIMGEMNADDGLITFSKDKTVGYLPQNALLNSTRTIYDELLSVKQPLIDLEERMRDMEYQMNLVSGDELDSLMDKYTNASQRFEREGGLTYKSEITGVLKGLGFDQNEFNREISTLSGGQKTRVALGKLLITKPDLIILDEPTNHLDMTAIMWLVNYLLNYKGTVLIVSHDRYFLDKIVNKVFELENGHMTTFTGNYTDYATKKEILRIAAMNAYRNNQREIKHQEEVIKKLRSFNREKSIKRAESREKMLNKMEVVDKPLDESDSMHLTLTPRFESGNDVLTVTGLSKSFDENHLFSDVDFFIQKGEHVAIIGDNGTGKSTLLKIINNVIDADSGMIKTGTNVEIGYYDQEHHVLNDSKSIFDEISDDYPTLTNTEIRNVLAAFLFTGEDVYKLIGSLSGGEKGRVLLAKLMLSQANFLILDEPTNHLDITSKEILEDALNSYTGTVLYVSHDRYFINRTASRIMDLTSNGFINYIGNYDYYLEKKDELSPASDSKSVSAATLHSTAGLTAVSGNTAASNGTNAVSEGKLDWKAQKEMQAVARKRENEIAKLEALIEKLETRDKEIEELMASPEICNVSAKLMELQTEKDSIAEQLLEAMERWEELA
ncbi:MAG: ABC-F family ATP-binding cassette domain-containing protein [Lachnospiraceae bacterium]|nr:ABC-F family ATP-binding cassette domain-containing protein [Lachnospiraceae bacterium]